MENLKNSELKKENKDLSDFIDSANKNFERKIKMMEILNDLSHKLKKEEIILKQSSSDKPSQKNISKEKNKDKKDELSLSLIKESSIDNSINEVIDISKNKNLEISIVQLDKLEEKEKNIIQIKNLINKCEEDIKYIKNAIHKYKNTSNNLIMESGVFNDRSMVFINKKEEEENMDTEMDNSEKKIEYLEELKNLFITLKKKLVNISELYETEKEFTLIKKFELEKLDNIKNEYKKLKQSLKVKTSKKY